MTLEREALEFLLCLVPKHRLLSDDPVPILRAALDRLEAAEARVAALEKALRECRYELRNYERDDLGCRRSSVTDAIEEADTALAREEGP